MSKFIYCLLIVLMTTSTAFSSPPNVISDGLYRSDASFNCFLNIKLNPEADEIEFMAMMGVPGSGSFATVKSLSEFLESIDEEGNVTVTAPGTNAIQLTIGQDQKVVEYTLVNERSGKSLECPDAVYMPSR